MDEERTRLHALLTQMRGWEQRIRKTTFSSAVTYEVDPGTGEFTVTASWVTKAGVPGAYSKKYTKELVFGPPAARRGRLMVQKRVCTYMREFMQEVLRSRGV